MVKISMTVTIRTRQEPEIAEEEVPISAADALHAEVFEFAVKAVKMAKIVPAIRGKKTPQRVKEYNETARTRARQIFDIKRPGDWYLVRFGNTRKGSGTFYTRRNWLRLRSAELSGRSVFWRTARRASRTRSSL